VRKLDRIAQTTHPNVFTAPSTKALCPCAAQARAALDNPYLNLLFTASRLRGYLNHSLGLSPSDTRRLRGYWLFYLGPAWHNWPPGADAYATWPYAFQGFFKGLFYQTLLSADPTG
jgi:hypothetical protein